jgi:2,3-bisphosphoglycerate-independent phosphoglycerate mutase
MVGHTGNIIAVTEAIKSIDSVIEQITNSVLEIGGALIITADHGNAEAMIHLKEEGDPETLHTLNPVPFILVKPNSKKETRGNILKEILTSKFTLADIAPTILELMKLKKPKEMTGKSLLKYLI